jgi:hypothetical protein
MGKIIIDMLRVLEGAEANLTLADPRCYIAVSKDAFEGAPV